MIDLIGSAQSLEAQNQLMSEYYVDCSQTGARISLADLKYWCVEKQIAYSGPDVVVREHFYPDLVDHTT